MKYIIQVNDKFYAGNMQFTSRISMAKQVPKDLAEYIKSKLDNHANNVRILTVVEQLRKNKEVKFNRPV